MPQIVTNVTVLGSRASFTPGPTFLHGETVRIQVSGAVLFAADPFYTLPEGAYPPTYPNTHALDDSAILPYGGGWPSSGVPVGNTAPLCLSAVVYPDGITPPFTGDLSGLKPDRDTTFSAAALSAAGASDESVRYRLWFVVNDILADFADNSGQFDLVITRYVGDNPMAEPLVALIRPQIAIETAFGDGTTPTRMLNCFDQRGFKVEPDQKTESRGIAGFGFETHEDTVSESGKGTWKAVLDYRDFPYLCLGPFGAPTHTTLVSGVEQSVFNDVPSGQIASKTFAVEMADPNAIASQKVAGLLIPGFKIETEADKHYAVSGNIESKAIQPYIAPTAGDNSIQAITVNGTPTGGTFKLADINGNATSALSYLETHANVQTAIRLLGGDWASATVTGSDGGPWAITSPTGKFVPLLTPIYTDSAGANTLTGGTTPTVTSAYTTRGGMKMHDVLRAMPGEVFISFASSLADLTNAPSVAAEHYKTGITIADRIEQKYKQNVSNNQPGFVRQKTPDQIKDVVQFTTAYDATVQDLITASQSARQSLRFARVKFVGPQIGSTGYYFSVIFDFAARPVWKAINDSEGNTYAVDFDLNCMLDVATGFRLRITCISDIASYTTN